MAYTHNVVQRAKLHSVSCQLIRKLSEQNFYNYRIIKQIIWKLSNIELLNDYFVNLKKPPYGAVLSELCATLYEYILMFSNYMICENCV